MLAEALDPIGEGGVIVTGNNNQHDVIEHNHDGIIIPPRNQEALENAIREYINNPNLKKLYAQNGYNKIISNIQ